MANYYSNSFKNFIFEVFQKKSKTGPGYRLTPVQLKKRLIFNKIIGGILILLHLPLLLGGAVLIWFLVGFPLIYKGKRLGINKKSFNIYKFRTLPIDAQKQVGAELLSSKHGLASPLAQLVRDIRLDEMPQLFNIFNGDMDFIGPRPVREEVYNRLIQEINIEDYDTRFTVLPGLVGFAQLFTPHSTPKRIRSIIDSRYAKRYQNALYTLGIVFFTACLFFKKILTAFTWNAFHNTMRSIVVSQAQKKRLAIIDSVNVSLYIDGNWNNNIDLYNLNNSQMFIINNSGISLPPDHNCKLKISVHKKIRGQMKRKTALCLVHFVKFLELEDGKQTVCVYDYEPASPFNHYIIDQYLMGRSYA